MKIKIYCSAAIMLLFFTTYCVNGQTVLQTMHSSNGNFTSFTPEKTYADIARLTALTPSKYRNHPDFGKQVTDSGGWYELLNKRTLKTRTYKGSGNEVITETGYDNLNYVDANGWVRTVDIKLKPSFNGWVAAQQETPDYLYHDGSTALSLGGNDLMLFNKNVEFNGEDISTNNYTVGDNGMYIKNAVTNTDKIIRFGRGAIETDYSIKQPIKLNGDLIISEDIVLPSGYTISKNTDEDADENTVGALEVIGIDGKPAAEIRLPFCYDNRKNSITGIYNIQKREGGYRLEIQIPAEWLNDPMRQYPITIDPVVTGPITTWTGGKIPSCLSPNYGSGTITDTIPAGATAITHFYIQGSFYSPIIGMKYGSLKFVTACNAVTGTPPNSDSLPGIIYVPLQDFEWALGSCVVPSCFQQTIDLTMEVSRDSGGTTCDSTQYLWYDPNINDSYDFESYVVTNVFDDSCGDVWPGDANDDLTVNNYDLLPIGLYYGIMGPERDTITNTWAAHLCLDWDSTQTNGYNIKFADCNGDGRINSADTLAITLNYDDTHLNHSPRSASGGRSNGVPLYFVNDSSYYHAGSKVHIGVWLGNSTIEAANIYGLAYNIGLDTSLIQPGTLAFNYDSSFIGAKDSNTLSITHISGDVETAVTGTDHTNKTGYGKIGDLYFTLANNLTSEVMTSFSNYEAIDANGNQLTLSLGGDTVNIATGIKQLSVNSNQLSIFPNPTSGEFTIKLNGNQNGHTVEVYNVMGERIYGSVLSGLQNTIDLSLQPDGIYFVYLKWDEGVQVGKVLVAK